MEPVGLVEAKTHPGRYVAHAESGKEEAIIMRHNEPVAKIASDRILAGSIRASWVGAC